MSGRMEGTVVINGCNKSIKEFEKILNKVDEITWEEGYCDFENETYEFPLEYRYEIQNNIFAFDFNGSGVWNRYDSLMQFLKNMSSKLDLSFHVLDFDEDCTEDFNASFIYAGEIIHNKKFFKTMVDIVNSQDWDIDELIEHLTELVQKDPQLPKKLLKILPQRYKRV